MDWTATILAAANAKADPAFPLDGIDLLPVCTQRKKLLQELFTGGFTNLQNQKLYVMAIGNTCKTKKANTFLTWSMIRQSSMI